MRAILIVDDDELIHLLLKGILSDWEEIKSAYSADEALEFLEKELGYIVITDIHMPGGMDGIELLKTIRRKYSMTQVIVASATEDMNEIITAFSAGANDFITKPFNGEEVRSALMHTEDKLTRWEETMKGLHFRKSTKNQ